MSRNESPAHKRNFAKAKDTDGIIDLCSPVHTKPCRKQTPTISSQPNPGLSAIPHLKASVATSLFRDHTESFADVLQSRGNSLLTMEDEDDDGYWEPAGYASPRERFNSKDVQTHSDCIDNSSIVPVGDENSLSRHPQNSELIIDLCSPASSKDSPRYTRDSQFASTSPSVLDRTLHSSDDEEGSEENASGAESDDKSTLQAQKVPIQDHKIEARAYTSLSDRLAARRAFHSTSQSQFSEHDLDAISVHSGSSHASSAVPNRLIQRH